MVSGRLSYEGVCRSVFLAPHYPERKNKSLETVEKQAILLAYQNLHLIIPMQNARYNNKLHCKLRLHVIFGFRPIY